MKVVPTGSRDLSVARIAMIAGVLALLFAYAMARGAEPQAATPAPDVSKVEVVLPAAKGWQGRLIHQSDVGVWTVGSLKVFPLNGCPEVFALDDKGRCRILSCYSQRWTSWNTVEDFEWLGAFSEVDLDPKKLGVEMYTGGKRGNLYRIVAKDGGFDTSLIAKYPGEELHTSVGGDLLRSRPGNELLVFTHLGNVYDIRVDAASETGYSGPRHAVLGGRVRQAIVLPGDERSDPEIAVVLRSGEISIVRMKADGLDVRAITKEPMGFGRIAMRESIQGAPLVLYACRDDGVVVRLERKGDGSFVREVIFAGPQGPRGIAAGRFDADPAVETVAVFGYSKMVQMLSRKPGEKWTAETIFEEIDRGHWLHAMEIDGRNSTMELIGSGYSGRVFQLSRDPGYGLDGVPVDPSPMKAPDPPPAEKPRSTTDLEPRSANSRAPRLAVVSGARTFGDLLPFGYRGGFETKTLLFDTLVRVDARGRIAPSLAESWQIENDGRTFVFTLRPDAKFADGTPLDAAAVRLHLKRVCGLPEHSWLAASDAIREVVVLSARQFRIDLDRPIALLHDLCAINPFAITAPTCFDKNGERVAAVGAGSYRLESLEAESFRLVRAPGVADRNLPEIELVPFARTEIGAMLDAYREGRIDGFADGAYEVLPRDAIDSLRRAPDTEIVESRGSSLIYLSFKGTGATTSIDLRRAIRESIDRRHVVAALRGAADPVGSFSGATLSIDGANPPRMDRPLRLLINSDSSDMEIAHAVVESLTAAGIDTCVEERATPDHAIALERGEYDLRIERTWGVPYDPYLSLVNRFLPPPNPSSAATDRAIDPDEAVASLIRRLSECAEPAHFEETLRSVYTAIDERCALVALCIPRRYAVSRASRLSWSIDEDLHRVTPQLPRASGVGVVPAR